MSGNTLRRHLSMPGLLSPVRRAFDAVPDPVDPRGLSLSGCLMSGLAVFSLKMPSLLQFDSRVRLGEDPALRRNVRALFGVGRVPSDTAMRERLDRIGPRELRGAFRAVHASLQRGKALRSFTAPGGHLLLSMDGTEYFSSAKTGCARRCRRRQGDGFANCRRMPGAAFAHPDRSQVFPAAPGMIRNEDGASKNDCGRNAAARLLADFRRGHPHLKTIVIGDGLFSDGPGVKLLKSKDLRFIPGAKPGDHRFMSGWLESRAETSSLEVRTRSRTGGTVHSFRWAEDMPLNETRFGPGVNLGLRGETVMQVMRAARSRWRIENETFQTLRRSGCGGCGFEHNFGRGDQNLSCVFATLMMPAFLTDQTQEACCGMFRQALEARKRKLCFRDRMRKLLEMCVIKDWATLWRAAAARLKPLETGAVLPGAADRIRASGNARIRLPTVTDQAAETHRRRRRTAEAAHPAGGRGATRRRSRSRQFREISGNWCVPAEKLALASNRDYALTVTVQAQLNASFIQSRTARSGQTCAKCPQSMRFEEAGS